MLKPIKTVLKFNPCFCWHKKNHVTLATSLSHFRLTIVCYTFLFCILLIGVKFIAIERRKTLTLLNTVYIYCDLQNIIKILCSDETLLSAKDPQRGQSFGYFCSVTHPITFTKHEGQLLFPAHLVRSLNIICSVNHPVDVVYALRSFPSSDFLKDTILNKA